MVSTRQCAMKFTVGETVLCFEPDTTKAKVLYESKILEVDLTKDERGKKVPEYFVHFSGWNKSWDRWVLEDQILEATEANRLKMKKLHEDAINSLKNKKKRKALLSASESSQSSNEALTTPQQPIPPPLLSCIELEIPSLLKLKLEDDCYFIKRKKKLVRLPRSPNVLEILNEYLDHVTQQETQDAQSSLKIVKEVLDGLRIYFDFTLPSLLLYNFERDQYDQVMGLSEETSKNKSPQPCGEHFEVPILQHNTENSEKKAKQEKNDVSRGRKSPTTTEVSKENPKQDNKSSDRVLRRRSKRQKVSTGATSCPATSNSSPISNPDSVDPLNVSCNMNEEINNKAVKRKLRGVDRSEEPVKSGTEEATADFSGDLTINEQNSNSLINKTPSMVYGCEHLLRLFVKLPSLLASTTIQEHRLSLLLQQLSEFLKYLSSRTNTLFSEDFYQDIFL